MDSNEAPSLIPSKEKHVSALTVPLQPLAIFRDFCHWPCKHTAGHIWLLKQCNLKLKTTHLTGKYRETKLLCCKIFYICFLFFCFGSNTLYDQTSNKLCIVKQVCGYFPNKIQEITQNTWNNAICCICQTVLKVQ